MAILIPAAAILGARLAESIMPQPVAGEIQSAADTLLCDNDSGLDPNAALIALVAKGARIPVNPAFSAKCLRRGKPIAGSPSSTPRA